MIPGLKSSFDTISIGEQFVKLAQQAAGPAFELQFHTTQEAVLDRMDAEIAALQAQSADQSATVLLDIQVAAIEREIGAINEYHSRTKTNRINTETTIAALADLVALADSSTVAEFDARLATTIADIEKIDAPLFEQYGAPDGLRKAKQDALDQLNNLVHNNFATADDVTAVQATLNGISADLGTSLEITRINEDAGFNLAENTQERLSDLNSQISNIKLTAQADKIESIERKREQFSAILTAISLSFEISQELTNFISANTVLSREIDPGSVLNLFT